MKSKITIIIPVYNTEKYLHQCLKSIEEQTDKSFKKIYVDDASTDRSLQILEEYEKKDKNITVLSLKENTGGGAAKNKAIELVKTPYFMIVDSDDYIDMQ
ncbi:MAG: glycosyltransferase family 2 protein, partial [Alphaproteobacteria bacterium]|nr:glycosyltransferase family 2 protein [Alphaproteobacteria bacterium]